MKDILQNAKRLSLLKLNQVSPEYKRLLFQDVFSPDGKIAGVMAMALLTHSDLSYRLNRVD